MNMQKFFRTKAIIDTKTPSQLRNCLNAFDLTLFGIGAIIGAGIFVLTGVAAATKAGPAVMLSFLLAGLVSTFSALSYAELAASIGGCGSAYGYAFVGFGELIAWLIGWDLLLEYGLACSTVAVGWSGYANNVLAAVGLHLPVALTKNPTDGGLVNLPAMLVIFFIMALLSFGVKESSRFNNIVVFIKLITIGIFIAIAGHHFNIANWHPFLPFGWDGVINGAGLIFFAFIGFDAVSTTAEEALNPKRDLPIGIIASLLICTLIYILVAGLLTGMMPYTTLNVSSPIAHSLLVIGYNFAGAVVATGAIAGLTTVILVMYYGFTRIYLAIARDGLLPRNMAKINGKTQTPTRIIIIFGCLMALIAGFSPLHNLAELVNIGTLAAFAVVCGGVVMLRFTKPDLPRPFKTPFSPLIPAIGVISAIYLMCSLPAVTWIRFIIWMLIGLVVYFTYGQFHSALNKQK